MFKAAVLIPMVWGFIGSKHARFSNFVYSPTNGFGYLKNLIARKPQHYIGHNPAGRAMVVTLLCSLAGTTLTGMKLYAVEENEGQLAITTPQVQFISVISEAETEDGDEDEEEFEDMNNGYVVNKQAEEFWEKLHEASAILTLLLVFLHVVGVFVSSIINKENLVKAMLTSKKEVDDSYH